MGSSVNLRTASVLAIALAVPVALAVACSSSSNNPAPNSTVYNTDDASDDGTAPAADTGTGTTNEASTSPNDSGSTGNPTPVGDAGADGAAACTSALTDAGCYTCPSTGTQFLNQCSALNVQCSGFNNLARLPNYDGGALPPLH
jgi:hypothetical protein